MAVLPIRTAIEFSFEMLLNTTGAVALSPANMRLYVVRPGQSAAEEVIGAAFSPVSAGTYRTIIPADLVDNPGVMAAFVLADGSSSNNVYVYQIERSVVLGQSVWVPFIGRQSTGKAVLNLTAGALSLAVELGPPSMRGVLTSEFKQLQDIGLNATAFYMVMLRPEEVPISGVLTYSLEATGLQTVSYDLQAGGATMSTVLLQLQPAYSLVGVQILLSSNNMAYSSGLTNGAGELSVSLPDGEYIIRLSKDNWVFNRNNIPLTVLGNADVQVQADRMLPQAQPTGFTKVNFRILKPTGEPLPDVKVLFAPKLAISGGAGVVKTGIAVLTDTNGQGSINLISGLQVVVSVEGTRLFEEFTVPNVAETNLFDHISFQDKGFDYHLAEFDYGIRRTLNN